MSETKLPVSIYAEATPNPKMMKFVANQLLVESGNLEFSTPEEAVVSPLAERIFNFPFVDGIFMSQNFITVSKNDLVEWQDVFTDLREYIQNYIREGKAILTADAVTTEDGPAPEGVAPTKAPVAHASTSNDIEKRIVEVLEEYVQPAVANDGGAIHFQSFTDGVLKVTMSGACSGCPSSAQTLKNGVQNLMTRMVPEVLDIVAEEV